MYCPSGSQFIFNPTESRKARYNYIKMVFLTSESNNNHLTPYKFAIISFDLSAQN